MKTSSQSVVICLWIYPILCAPLLYGHTTCLLCFNLCCPLVQANFLFRCCHPCGCLCFHCNSSRVWFDPARFIDLFRLPKMVYAIALFSLYSRWIAKERCGVFDGYVFSLEFHLWNSIFCQRTLILIQFEVRFLLPWTFSFGTQRLKYRSFIWWYEK